MLSAFSLVGRFKDTIAIPSWRSILTISSADGSGFSALPSPPELPYLPPVRARHAALTLAARSLARTGGRTRAQRAPRRQRALPNADEAAQGAPQRLRRRREAPREHEPR